VIYVYAVTGRRDPPAARGLDEAPLHTVSVGSLSLVCSRHERATFEPTAASLWRHEAIAEALLDDGPVLPVRFGTSFAHEAAVTAVVARHHDRLADALEAVRDCVEIGVRALWDDRDEAGPPAAEAAPAGAPSGRQPRPPPDRSTGVGTAYLMDRLAVRRSDQERRLRAQRLADSLHAPLAELACDSTRRVLPDPGTVVKAAYLVPAGAVDAFIDLVRTNGVENEGVRILCTGPWPPYHFAPDLAGTGDADG
jgi:hypothetical protein